MAIKHKKNASRPDNNDASEVQPSDWNDDHAADGVIGAFLALTIVGDTVPYISTDGSPALLPITTPGKNFLSASTTALMRTAIGAIGLDSPAFTGNPTAPTPTPGDNDTSLATTAFVQDAITSLIGGAPGAMNTLKELADAIADDASYSTTISAALGNRLRFDSSQSLSSGQKTQAQSNLGLGTAAVANTGTGAGNVVALDGAGKLPAVDGSQLTNLPSGVVGAGYGGTSTTSLTPATGSQTFATQTGMAYTNGSRVRATSVSNAAVWMEGIVSAYSSGSMTINVDAIGTATAKADWAFTIAGTAGTSAAPTKGTSATSLTPAVAAKIFTTQAGLAFGVGSRIRAASAATPSIWMEGPVTAYSGTSLTIGVDLIGTATAASDWTLTFAGERGQTGATGTTGAQGPQGTAGATGAQGPQGVQGPAGTFPIGAGAVGTFALAVAGGGATNASGTAYGGSWIKVSELYTGSTNDPVALWQRYA